MKPGCEISFLCPVLRDVSSARGPNAVEAGLLIPVDNEDDNDNDDGNDDSDNDGGNDDNDMLCAPLSLLPNAMDAGFFALIDATGLIDNDDDDNDDKDDDDNDVILASS